MDKEMVISSPGAKFVLFKLIDVALLLLLLLSEFLERQPANDAVSIMTTKAIEIIFIVVIFMISPHVIVFFAPLATSFDRVFLARPLVSHKTMCTTQKFLKAHFSNRTNLSGGASLSESKIIVY
jgi:hypothetical protein